MSSLHIHRHRRPHRREAGLSLVELMVGMAIGLVAVLIMAQTVTFFEGQKRGTSGGADAQNTGMLATYTVESDIKQAGYGLTSLGAIHCTLDTAMANLNGRRLVPLMVVPDGLARGDAKNILAIPPGDGGSDALAVIYSNTGTTPEGVAMAAITGGNTYQFSKNVTGFNVNDYVLVSEAGQPCTLGQITGVNAAARQIVLNHSTSATYTVNNARLVNLGPAGLVVHVYAIRNSNLTVCDGWANDCSTDLSTKTRAEIDALWVPIAANISGFRAQYGWDISGTPDMTVDAYCRSRPKADGAAWSTVTNSASSPACPSVDDGSTVPNVACDWSRIATLRFALVARSAEAASESMDVTPATITLWPNADASSGGPTSVGPVFSVPSRRYRYKLFQSTVPVRNVIWLGAQSSCT